MDLPLVSFSVDIVYKHVNHTFVWFWTYKIRTMFYIVICLDVPRKKKKREGEELAILIPEKSDFKSKV